MDTGFISFSPANKASAFFKLNRNVYWDYPHQTKPVLDPEDLATYLKAPKVVNEKFLGGLLIAELASYYAVIRNFRAGNLSGAAFVYIAIGLYAVPALGFYVIHRKQQDFCSLMAVKYESRGLNNEYLWNYHKRVGNIKLV
mmetsp:Transcript_32052/g.55282  ORF Transcript_32052/g.55282 Transcript_32052/m.55282 type:complete len:141 (+) Transcript_32052:1026-1448(+)